MHVVVVGLGRVGRGVVQALQAGRHDVVAVDKDPAAVRFAQENFDVGAIRGFGANPEVLRQAGCAHADMVVAVTHQDETNIVVALTGRSLGAGRALARVQGEGWSGIGGGDGVEQGMLGVDVVFNPRVLAALELARVARSHGALEVIDLANDRIEVVKLRVAPTSRYANKDLARVQFPPDVRVGAVVRDGDLFVPGGADVLMPGDEVYLVGKRAAIDATQAHITVQDRANRVCIVGGGVTGGALARMLAGTQLMVIEKDPVAARRLAEQLAGVTVVVGDGTDLNIMREHHVETYDLFAAVTDDDEVNLLSGLLARKLGVNRVATLIHRAAYHDIYHQIGIDVVLSPRTLAEQHILRYCRDEMIRSISVLEGGVAEVIELKVAEGARIAGTPLSSVRFPQGAIVCAIVKPDRVVVPGGTDVIETGDTVIVLTRVDAYKAVVWHFKPGLF